MAASRSCVARLGSGPGPLPGAARAATEAARSQDGGARLQLREGAHGCAPERPRGRPPAAVPARRSMNRVRPGARGRPHVAAPDRRSGTRVRP